MTALPAKPATPWWRPGGRRPPRRLVTVALGLVGVICFPIGYLLWQALGAAGPGSLVGASRLRQLTLNTLGLTVIVLVGALALGGATAWITTRRRIPAPRIWSVLLAIPLVIPSYVLALVLLGATGNRGILSQLVVAGGGSPLPIPRGLVGAALVLIVSTYPYVHLSLVPAIRNLDPAQEEVARSLGASRSRRIRTIVIPQLAPSLRSASLLVALYTIADFGAVSLLSYDTFTRAIFLQYAGRVDRRPATLLAAALLGLAAVVLLVARRPSLTRARASAFRPTASALRKSKLAVAGLSFHLLIVLVVPVAVLAGWWIRGTAAGRDAVAFWAEAARSVGVSVLSAALVSAVAIPLAVLTIRYQSRIGRVVENVAWTVSGLPHLTVGLAVLLTGISLVRPLYQSLFLLLVAYLMMFLPQALSPTQNALQSVSPQLEEASRSLGRPALATFRSVTFPLVSKGFLAGAGLVFLTTMKELPATLLLRPTGFETLAVRIWSTTSEGFYTRASSAALALILVSAIPLGFLVTNDNRGP